MNRRRVIGVVAVLAAVYLVVSAAPVAAANIVVYKHYTTASELDNNGQFKQGIEFQGSGEDGHVEYVGQYSDSLESWWDFSEGSGSLTTSVLGDHSADLVGATWTSGSPGTAVQTSPTANYVSANDPTASTAGVEGTQSFTISADVRLNSTQTSGEIINIGGFDVRMGMDDGGRVEFYTNYGGQGNFVRVKSDSVPTGEYITVTGVFRPANNGTMEIWVDGELEGQATDVPAPDDSDNTLSFGYNEVFGGGSLDGDIDNARIYSDDLPAYQIENIAEGTEYRVQSSGGYVTEPIPMPTNGTAYVDVELENATGTFQVRGVTPDGWENIGAKTTVTSSGNYSLQFDPTGYDEINVGFDVNATDGDYTARLNEIVIERANRAPEIDESTADPDNTTQTSDVLSVSVADPDLPSVDGESVTVEFRRSSDGSVIGTDTLQQNGTASTTWSGVESGQSNWYVVARDTGGLEDTSGAFSWIIPEKLRVLNESAPTELVKNASVELQFYGTERSNFTVRRSTEDGIINMSGLPASEEFVVVARSDDYYDRRIYIRSLVQQQEIYLLPRNGTIPVRNSFVLDDKSGGFAPSETVLRVEKPITKNGTTEYYQAVGGDFGAANEFPTVLEKNQRYRLIIRNSEGDSRVLGSYVAKTNGTRELSVGKVSIDRPDGDEYVVDVTKQTNSTDASLTVRYLDSTDSTEEIRFVLHETGNRSNVVDQYESFGTGNVTVELLAGGEPAKLTLTVEGSRKIDGESREISQKYPIRGGATALDVPFTRWVGILGIVSVIFVASLATPRFVAPILVTAVVFAGVLMYLRIVQLSPSLWWVAATISGAAVYKSRR